ncbi:hypothetical protein [Cellulosimicrobium cellulans]|uniref:hypothetical protein n=1 Tax=Cellulosimicrobium cellulans TaxID=1710 RepID=UPI00130DA420|nr:hypothetical protein [Cellulosimicrobium cellulans]
MTGDRSLLGGEFAPLTDSIQLIQEDPQEVAAAVLARMRKAYPKARNWVQEGRGGLREAIAAMEHVRPMADRRVVMRTTRDGWTAGFANGRATFDWGLAEAGGERWMFRAFLPRGAGEYDVALERSDYWNGVYEGRNVRVMLAREGSRLLEVQHLGERWPFEPEYKYRRRVRPEVMTADVMAGFVRELGFDWVWDDEQYAPDGRFWLVGTSFFAKRRFFGKKHLNERFTFDQAREQWQAELTSHPILS